VKEKVNKLTKYGEEVETFAMNKFYFVKVYFVWNKLRIYSFPTAQGDFDHDQDR